MATGNNRRGPSQWWAAQRHGPTRLTQGDLVAENNSARDEGGLRGLTGAA